MNNRRIPIQDPICRMNAALQVILVGLLIQGQFLEYLGFQMVLLGSYRDRTTDNDANQMNDREFFAIGYTKPSP